MRPFWYMYYFNISYKIPIMEKVVVMATEDKIPIKPETNNFNDTINRTDFFIL